MTNNSTHTPTLAASVASEDLRCGEFVAVLNEIVEFPAFYYCETYTLEETIRVRYCGIDAGTPMKIKAICLPFVFVKQASGQSATLDVRQVQLVRLNKAYAQKVWRTLKTQTRGKKRRKSGC